jgi:LacI family transcriptional regulator
MAKAHITIHDIAREMNISASTVSRALHNHPRISGATKARVQELARKYNYQPNVVASSLRQGRSKTVGVIVPRINRNFFSNVIGGIEKLLAASGYNLMICQTHESMENEKSALQTLVNARVDAIMLSLSMETSDYTHIRMLQDSGTRIFFFDRILEGLTRGAVVVNDRMGAYLCVKHLLEQGYRKIFHIAGAGHVTIYRERKLGYLDAMAEAGIDVPDRWILEKPMVIEGGESAFREAMSGKEKAEAFFCAGDYAALGLMQAALKAGMRIPDDLGVCGFANEPFTAYLQPSLTTVDQCGEEMGTLMAEMFLDCCENNADPSLCDKKVLEPRLIVRESSKRN